MKTCSICKQEKTLEEFSKQAKSPDGRSSYCRPCHREYTKNWTATNQEKVKQSRREYNAANQVRIRARTKKYREEHKDYFYEAARKYYLDYPERALLYEARKRAKKFDLPCTITWEEIKIPKVCPILGIRLERGATINNRDSAPSLDRILPESGYVPGNIAVISYRANRMKNDGTAEEHRKIAAWMDEKSPSGYIPKSHRVVTCGLMAQTEEQ